MNEKLYTAMKEKGDTQQDLAMYLGLRTYISVFRKLHGQTSWSKEQIKLCCRRYKKSRKELGFEEV